VSSTLMVSVFAPLPLFNFGGFVSFWGQLKVVVFLGTTNSSSFDVLRRLDRRFEAVDSPPELSAFLFGIVLHLLNDRYGGCTCGKLRVTWIDLTARSRSFGLNE